MNTIPTTIHITDQDYIRLARIVAEDYFDGVLNMGDQYSGHVDTELTNGYMEFDYCVQPDYSYSEPDNARLVDRMLFWFIDFDTYNFEGDKAPCDLLDDKLIQCIRDSIN